MGCFSEEKSHKVNDNYAAYVRAYGKVASGAKLEDTDYGARTPKGFVAYGEDGQTAVAMAAQDVKANAPMRPKSEFETQMQRLLGGK